MVSLFVLFALAGFIAGPPASAYAVTVQASRVAPGSPDVIYGKVRDADAKGQPDARVVLYYYDNRGFQHIVTICYSNKNGVYRIAPYLATGDYYVQVNNPSNTLRGHTKFHVTKGYSYRVSAQVTSTHGVLFYLPIFSY